MTLQLLEGQGLLLGLAEVPTQAEIDIFAVLANPAWRCKNVCFSLSWDLS